MNCELGAIPTIGEKMDLAFRTRNACDQLMRYGGGVATAQLADVLDVLADINDDIQHGRNPTLIRGQVERAKALLDAVGFELSGSVRAKKGGI